MSEIVKGDCLDVMAEIPDQSIDMILCDLPYGTTACKWDAIIPFDKLWRQYERVIKDNGAIVLTACQPFTSALVMSNTDLFKYEWIWEKSKAVGFVNAKLKPMPKHESVLVFSKGKTSNGNENNMVYKPQDLIPFNKTVNGRKGKASDSDGNGYGRPSMRSEYFQEFTNYPTSVIQFSSESTPLHPTQKPVALFEYLIRTYTNPGDVVMDNCSGSGTTAIACLNTGRNYICIERETKYYELSVERIRTHEAKLWEEAFS